MKPELSMTTPKEKKGSKKTPRALRPSIICDPVDARDFRTLNIQYACEQCSHFSPPNQSCTLGFLSKPHLQDEQLKMYFLTGRMAICRFHEID